MIVHLLVENTIYAYGTVVSFFIKEYMMPYLKTKEPRFDDIVSLFKENRQTVQSLDSAIYLPKIDDRLIFRPGFNGIVPYAVQVSNSLSG